MYAAVIAVICSQGVAVLTKKSFLHVSAKPFTITMNSFKSMNLLPSQMFLGQLILLSLRSQLQNLLPCLHRILYLLQLPLLELLLLELQKPRLSQQLGQPLQECLEGPLLLGGFWWLTCGGARVGLLPENKGHV